MWKKKANFGAQQQDDEAKKREYLQKNLAKYFGKK